MIDLKNFKYDWQFLRDFFRISYLRYLVTWFALVPLALAVLGDLPESIHLPLGNGLIHFQLPFKWWLLWWSSFLYVVALILYTVRCPSFVKRYKDYTAYEAWGHSKRWIIWEWNNFLRKYALPTDTDILVRKELAALSSKNATTGHQVVRNAPAEFKVFEPQKDPDETWFVFRRGDQFYRLGLGPNSTDQITKHSELFWELYGAEASSRHKSRYLIWGILSIAGLLFAWVVFENIWTVLKYLYLHP